MDPYAPFALIWQRGGIFRIQEVMARCAKLAGARGKITHFAPEASLPFSIDTHGLSDSLCIERLLAEELNARDNEWKCLMLITGGLEFVRGIRFSV